MKRNQSLSLEIEERDETELSSSQESDLSLEESGDDSGDEMEQKQEAESMGVSGTAIMASVRHSVFKIQVTSTVYSHEQPWSNPRIQDSSGSGFIVDIDGERYISTNAHVAEGAEVIKVRSADGRKNYPTQVLWVDHECDLALLALPPGLAHSAKPLDINSRPLKRGERVYVVGFPQMGEEVCITNGVVSRRELDEYMHSGRELLQYGVDAVINPGNSGGPVVDKRGSVVGWAFQGAGNGQGFIIPVDVYEHMARDFVAKQQGGFPDLSIEWQTMTNKALRTKYGMQKSERGVLVNKVHALSDANGVLLPNDIIIAINGRSLSNEGAVKFGGFGRINFEYLISRTSLPGEVNLKVRRQGQLQDLTIPLRHGYDRTQMVKWQYEKQPDYFIYHGIVLKVLTQNDGLQIGDEVKKKHDTDELVIVNKVLNSRYTEGYEDIEDEIVTHINGKEIENINQAVQCFSDVASPYFQLKLKSGFNIVIPNVLQLDPTAASRAMRHHQKILQQYRILEICSDNLKPLVRSSVLNALVSPSSTVTVNSSGLGSAIAAQETLGGSAALAMLTPGQRRFARTLQSMQHRLMHSDRTVDGNDSDQSDDSFIAIQTASLEGMEHDVEEPSASSGVEEVNVANQIESPSSVMFDSSLLSNPVERRLGVPANVILRQSEVPGSAVELGSVEDDALDSLASVSEDDSQYDTDHSNQENQEPEVDHGYNLRSTTRRQAKRVRFSDSISFVSSGIAACNAPAAKKTKVEHEPTMGL